ncbi:MAG: stage II sporulation protein M, partial [Candidatus Woesearchaeota archaeon]
FFNNIKVLLFCILFSFLYGAGAIFILLWNASVIGAAIGMFIRNSLSEIFLITGNLTIADYFSVVSIGLTKYIIHGFPEILAYFVGALAGGIISIAVINHDFSTRKFEHILVDAADLLMLSIFLIFLAALLEVYVTPLIF